MPISASEPVVECQSSAKGLLPAAASRTGAFFCSGEKIDMNMTHLLPNMVQCNKWHIFDILISHLNADQPCVCPSIAD